MIAEESSQAAELKTYHRDMNPSFCAGLRGFVVANQSPVTHQPTESSLHYPASGQYAKALHRIGAFDHFHFQLGTKVSDRLRKRLPAVSAIDPQPSKPGEAAQHSLQQRLRAVAVGGASRSYHHAKHQAQGVDQHVALAALEALARIVAHTAAVRVGLDALAVQDGGRGAGAFVFSSTDVSTEAIVDGFPGVVEGPLSEDMVDGFPGREVHRHQTPLDASSDHIKDSVDDAAAIGGRSSAFAGFREHRFEESPLGVRNVGIVYSGFHRSDRACAEIWASLCRSLCQGIRAFLFNVHSAPTNEFERQFNRPAFSDTLLGQNIGTGVETLHLAD